MIKKLFIAFLILTAGILTGCFNNHNLNSNQGANENIQIGTVLFLTGNQSALGEEVKNALILANQDKQNIQLIIEDSQDSPTEAIDAYYQLKAQGIPLIISAGDQVGYALSPLANNDELVIFNLVAASDDINLGDYVYRGWITAKEQAKLIAEYAANDLNLQKLAVIYIDNTYGESYKSGLIESFPNGSITSQQSYSIDDKDLKTQIAKSINSKPQAIVVAGFGPAYSVVVRQLREMGWQGIILTDNTLSIPYFFEQIGIDNLTDTYYTSTLFDLSNPTTQSMSGFIANYRQKFNQDPSFVAAFSFDAYNLIISAINNCPGYRSQDLKKCLEDIQNFQGVMGEITFEDHAMRVPLVVKKAGN